MGFMTELNPDQFPIHEVTPTQQAYLDRIGYDLNDPKVQQGIDIARRPSTDMYPKAKKRIIAYTDDLHGLTACPTCAKHTDEMDPKVNPFVHPLYNTEVQVIPGSDAGDLIVCTWNCGKNIVGRRKDFGY